MTPSPEKVDWNWVAREMGSSAAPPPPCERETVAGHAAGSWRVISQDGSRRVPCAGGSRKFAAAPGGAGRVAVAPSVRGGQTDARREAAEAGGGQHGVSLAELIVPGSTGHTAAPPVAMATDKTREVMGIAAELAGRNTVEASRREAPLSVASQVRVPSALPARSKTAVPAAAAAIPAGRGLGVPVPPVRPTGSVAMTRGRLDPQLIRVMDAWPAVSRRTREAILAMIDVSLGKK
jgi:hypothetical protein